MVRKYNDPISEDDDTETKIFRAILHPPSKKNSQKILDLCNELPNGPLYPCTIHNSTVLHLVCYFKKFDVAKELLNILIKENNLSKLSQVTNEWGATILHDVAASNKGYSFAEDLLETSPQLLRVCNRWGESALFTAIRYGKERMYKLFAKRLDNLLRNYEFDTSERLGFFKRDDGLTVLHMAILTRQFDLALDIAKENKELLDRKVDKSKMTALQMLARSPTAFKSGNKLGILESIVYQIVDPKEEAGIMGKAMNFILCRCCCALPMIERVRKLKKMNETALELAKLLIKSDNSWKHTYKPNLPTPKCKAMPSDKTVTIDQPIVPKRKRDSAIIIDHNKIIEEEHSNVSGKKEVTIIEQPLSPNIMKNNYENVDGSDDTPLFLAAMKGCLEIVKEILRQHPRAVDYLNKDQENLFHVAVKSRNLEIFNYVRKKQISLRGQLIAVDSKNNCLLHMVGSRPAVRQKLAASENNNSYTHPIDKPEKLDNQPVNPEEKDLVDAKIKSSVWILSNELRLMKELEDICPDFLKHHRNNDDVTPRELFAMEKEKLRIEARDELKRTSEHCTVIIILIATVAFAAAYTVPGGPDEHTGLPLLLRNPLFLVFTVTDVLSLGFGLTAVVIFLTILTSHFRLKDFERSLPQRLLLGFTLLFLSVSMMMVAFAATIILTVNTKQRWTKIVLYIVAFLPVLIFMLSYVPFYKELLDTFNYTFKKITKSLPKPACASKPKHHLT